MNDTTDAALIQRLFDAADAEDTNVAAPQDETATDDNESEEAAPLEAEAEEENGEDQELGSDDIEDDSDGDETDDEDDEEETDDLYTVKVDGEDRQVTLDELKRGYSGQQYVQKGMAEVAEVKKQLTQAVQAFQKDQQAFLEFAQRVQSDGLKAAPQEPDPELLKTDPIGYMEAEAAYKQQMKAYQQEQTRLHQIQQQQQAAQEIALKQHTLQQQEILAQEFEEYRDPEKRTQFQQRLARGAVEYYGIPQEMLENVTDAFAVKMLHDAIRYRELQSGQAKARKKNAPRPATKPRGKVNANPKKRASRALEEAKRTQRPEAWHEVLKSMLE